MKKTIFAFFTVALAGFSACNSNQQDKEKQDSIEAAAAADSMLREATQDADTTLQVDSVVVDTTKTDTNQKK